MSYLLIRYKILYSFEYFNISRYYNFSLIAFFTYSFLIILVFVQLRFINLFLKRSKQNAHKPFLILKLVSSDVWSQRVSQILIDAPWIRVCGKSSINKQMKFNILALSFNIKEIIAQILKYKAQVEEDITKIKFKQDKKCKRKKICETKDSFVGRI